MSEIRCVQPGESGLYPLERQLGRWRRAWLRTFRKEYVAAMLQQREGSCPSCPHDIVDSRDLKLVRNVCGYSFPAKADKWRHLDKLPFAQQGLIEITVLGGGCALLAFAFASIWSIIPAAITAFYLWFFRDPSRTPPEDEQLVVAPCDGIVDDICEIEHCEWLGGPARRIGISLSLFDVHLNRAPIDALVTQTHYHRGVFRNAQRKGDHADNEQFWTVFTPERGAPIAVRQIAGPMARTIVNEARLGEPVARGERFGMIKFGSRTELYLPADAKDRLLVTTGHRVRGGETALLDRSALAARQRTPLLPRRLA